jgi:host factor-I protein
MKIIVERQVQTLKQTINIQDTFLNQIRKESVPVTIYLVNGYQLRGVVKGFDNFTIIIDSEGKQQMVYKHAISTFTPARPVSLMSSEEHRENIGAAE